MPIQLYPYQEALMPELMAILADPSKQLCILGLSTGTGKTYVALSMMLRGNCTFGILCPKTTLSQWQRSCEAVGVKPKFLLNPEALRTGRKKDILEKVSAYNWNWTSLKAGDVLILDEIHKLSGLDSQLAMMAASARKHGIKVLGLSASLADSPLKVRGLLHLAKKVEWNNFFTWARNVGCFREISIQGHPWRAPYGRACLKVMEDLNREFFPSHGVRLDSKDIPGYPECKTVIELVSPSDEARIAANLAYAELSEAIRHPEKAQNELVRTLRLRQRVEHTKIHVLKELVEDGLAEGNSIICAFNFREPLFELQKMFASENPAVVVGGQTPAERQAEVDRFQRNECRLLLIMVQAGGTGLDVGDNLGGHPRLMLANLPLSSVEFLQLLGRAHRSNSLTPTVNKLILLEGVPVEEKIFKILSRKVSQLSSLQGDDLDLNNYLV